MIEKIPDRKKNIWKFTAKDVVSLLNFQHFQSWFILKQFLSYWDLNTFFKVLFMQWMKKAFIYFFWINGEYIIVIKEVELFIFLVCKFFSIWCNIKWYSETTQRSIREGFFGGEHVKKCNFFYHPLKWLQKRRKNF